MSDERFEIALLGTIREGADPQAVKARIGKMFNADSAKVEQLLAGRRVVIKKNLDQPTAKKYLSALHGAGAECEIRSMSAPPPAAVAAPQAPAAPAPSPATSAGTPAAGPPQTDPLGITADQINELAATLAPVGSELQSEKKEIPEPEYDLSGFDMAPLGSTLGDEEKKPAPPPPDTSGLSLAD